MENDSASIRHRSYGTALVAVFAVVFAAAPFLRAANWTLSGNGTMTDGEWTLAVSGSADALSVGSPSVTPSHGVLDLAKPVEGGTIVRINTSAFQTAFPGERKPYGRAATSTIPASQWVAITPEPHTILIIQ